MTTINPLGVLHLCDFHICEQNASFVQRLFRAASELIAARGLTVDLVFVTGDLAATGRKVDYEVARPIIMELLSNISIHDPARLFIVPGNHDVNRTRINKIFDKGLRSSISEPSLADEVWLDQENRELILHRFKDFFEFVKKSKFCGHSKVIDHHGYKILISLLNSCWLSSSDSDKGALFLSLAQLESETRQDQDSDLKIALLHHPFSWLHDSEQNDVKAFCTNTFHIICSGHRHENESYTLATPTGMIYRSVANAMNAKSRDLGFTHLSIDLESRKITATHWRYENRRNSFVPDTALCDEGRHIVDLPPQKISALAARDERKYLQERSNKIQTSLTQIISNLAPEIFKYLSSELTEPAVELLNSDQPRLISLNDLVQSNENWLIHGEKLSGKTTLLKLLCVKMISSNRNAVYFAFTDIPSSDKTVNTQSQIATTLGFSLSRIRNLLLDNITLLIDDIDFRDTGRLATLSEWLTKHPKIRLVGVTKHSQVGTVGTADESLSKKLGNLQKGGLAPLALSQIQRIVNHLKKSGRLAGIQNIERLIRDTFHTELPRHIWVVLIYFDVHLRGAMAEGPSLSALLKCYTDLRLIDAAASYPPLGIKWSDAALQAIAAVMVDKSTTSLDIQDAVEVIAEEFKGAAFSVDFQKALEALFKSGIVVMNDEDSSLSFSLSVFQDFFYARHLAYHGKLEPNMIDIPTLRQIGGALGFLVEEIKSDALVLRCFELAAEAAPSPSGSLDPDRLVNIEAVPIRLATDLAKKFEQNEEKAAQAMDKIDSEARDSQRGKREAQQKRQFSPDQISAFIGSFASSLSILRHGFRLEARTKLECVDRAIDSTLSLIDILLGIPEETREFLDKVPEGKMKNTVLGLITSILILIGNVLVTSFGSAEHLRDTIAQRLDHEEDWNRKLILLTWHSCLGGDSRQLMDKFIDDKPPFFILVLVQLWFMFRYVHTSTIEGERDIESRSYLETATKALISRSIKPPFKRAAVNAETERYIKKADFMARKGSKIGREVRGEE